MSPEQQTAAMDQYHRENTEKTANQVCDAALAYFRRQVPEKDVVDFINNVARKISTEEKPGSPFLEVAALCIALIALIKGESIPPVPVQYAARFSAVQQEAATYK